MNLYLSIDRVVQTSTKFFSFHGVERIVITNKINFIQTNLTVNQSNAAAVRFVRNGKVSRVGVWAVQLSIV